MQIRVSTRDCRVAVGAAIVGLKKKFEEDKASFTERSYSSLYDGAVHNGVHVDENRMREMREMVDRDVQHAMLSHPANELLQVLNNFVDMLAYHKGDDIVIDDQDFNLIKTHLPTADVKSHEVEEA